MALMGLVLLGVRQQMSRFPTHGRKKNNYFFVDVADYQLRGSLATQARAALQTHQLACGGIAQGARPPGKSQLVIFVRALLVSRKVKSGLPPILTLETLRDMLLQAPLPFHSGHPRVRQGHQRVHTVQGQRELQGGQLPRHTFLRHSQQGLR